MDKERKKLDYPIRIEAVQYAEENLNKEWFQNRLFKYNK